MERDERGFPVVLKRGLVVLSLNLWFTNSRVGWKRVEPGTGNWEERCAALQKWIDVLSPDVMCFQEVLRGGGVDMIVDVLRGGREKTFPFVAYSAASPWFGADGVSFGNAIVSRFPFRHTAEMQLPVQKTEGSFYDEMRSVLVCNVQIPGKGVACIACTHLNYRLDQAFVRLEQVQALSRFVKEQRAREKGNIITTIIGGDFNATSDEDAIRFMKGHLARNDMFFVDAWEYANPGMPGGHTWSSRNPSTHIDQEPSKRIDYVFVSRAKLNGIGRVEDCQVVCNHPFAGAFPSDHFGVVAEIRLHESLDTVRSQL